MRRNAVSLVKIFVEPFMGFLEPQAENSFSPDRYCLGASATAFNSEKLCLLIFVFALVFIAVVSPILCFGSLLIKLHLQGLWYFWLITFSEIVYLVWLIRRKLAEK